VDATEDAAGLPPRKQVDDVKLIRAMAHPLRVALLDYLTGAGARTASECAVAVDSTASNCSWHLRQLARFGLVEPAEGTDGRERPWQACQVGISLGALGDLAPASRSAYYAVLAARLGHEHELTERFIDTADLLDPEWTEAAEFSSYGLRVTPAELTGLIEAVDALLRPYVAPIRTDAPPGAKLVHAGFRAFLRVEADGRPST
jgi:hypothetical protein